MNALLSLLPLLAALSADDDQFGRVWYDGQAELNGYRWQGTRYGELRTGEAVAIFVTEPIGAQSHVKVDRPDRADEDVLTGMKLNLVRDFATGIYDYNTMVSVFFDARDLSLLRLSFSSAEWCGHVYEDIDLRAGEVIVDVRSYFEGETERRNLARPEGGLVGEELLVLLRGLRGHVLEPGEERTSPFLSGPFERRLRHTPAAWGEVRIARERELREVEVPAGRFESIAYRIDASDGRTGRVLVEAAYPHRLLSWEWKRDGTVLDSGELLGSERMKYWELTGAGQEQLRQRLGFER